MKARVKATGEIIEFSEFMHLSKDDKKTYLKPEDLEFLDFPKDEPDYWEKLKHQYAGVAMQGILANCNHQLWKKETNSEGIAKQAYEIATTLVNRLKEEEK